MRVSITYNVDSDIVDQCSSITGLETSIDREGTGEILIGFSRLKIRENTILVQTASAGVDHMDFTGANENVTICSNAGAYSDVVAEMVFAQLLAHVKKICKFDASTRRGEFKREQIGSLEGLTMGILGYGGIGRQAARIAKAFDMKTIAYSRTIRNREFLDEGVQTPEELFSRSDVLLISTPLNRETRHMVNSELLSEFKGTYIVNIARAEVVDKDAMLGFLKSNPGKYYLSDVWWGEPDLSIPVPDNALLTPHVGGFTARTLRDATIKACENVRRFLDGHPENVVNLGEYS